MKKVVAEPGLSLPGANLDMERFWLHGPKDEAHGCAEQLNQGHANSQPLYHQLLSVKSIIY